LIDKAGCRVIIADDGIGLPEGVTGPVPGKLGAVIAQSLRQYAKARFEVESAPGTGVRVTIYFDRADAAPESYRVEPAVQRRRSRQQNRR
jgi:two-component sensor histidine kinase